MEWAEGERGVRILTLLLFIERKNIQPKRKYRKSEENFSLPLNKENNIYSTKLRNPKKQLPSLKLLMLTMIPQK